MRFHIFRAPRSGRGCSRLAFVLVALLATTACASTPDPHPVPEPEADAPRVVSLRFRGVASIPEDELAAKLFTRGPVWHGLKFWQPDPAFDAADLEEDLARISEIYREHGFYEAVARAEVDASEDGRAVRIEVRVEEGEPVQLADLRVELAAGADLDPEVLGELVASLPLSAGDRFGSRAYAHARRALLDDLGERGRPAATLDGGARVDLERREASIEWTLDPGPLVHFGEVRLSGLDAVDPELVRRELRFETGARYSLSAQRESERALRDTELFHAVAIRPEPPSPDDAPASDGRTVWPLEVRVRERPPRSVRVAVGYGTEEEFRGRIAWRHRNFLGGGRKFEISGEYSSLAAGGQLRFLQPHFLYPEMDLGVEVGALRETTPAFEALRTEERIQLTRPIVAPWTLRTGYAFELADVTEVRADEVNAEETSRVSSLFLGLRRETLDDRLRPTTGTWLDLYAEPALQVIGSSASYTTFVAELRGFESWRWFVLGARLRLGAIEPMLGAQRDDVPIYERFFSGGSTSVRGYGYQSLGPRDDDGDPLGGLSLAEASVEVRARLPFWGLSLVGFVDAGQVARGPWTFRGREVQFGAGPGLRLATPVGALRFDVGLPLNPRDDDDPLRLHFAVGHAF